MNKIILKSTATVATLMVIAPIAAPSVFAADANYSTPGDVEFVTGDTGTKPVDPENPGATVDPENRSKYSGIATCRSNKRFELGLCIKSFVWTTKN